MTEAPDDKKDLLSRAIKWGSGGLVALVLGGGGAFPFVKESIVRGAMDAMVMQLDTVYDIKPVPKNILPLLIHAADLKAEVDSTLASHTYHDDYQKGVNRLVMNTCQVVERDGLKFYNDTCNQTLWTIQNGYIYQAVKQSDAWYYFPFQWQIPAGGDNRIQIYE